MSVARAGRRLPTLSFTAAKVSGGSQVRLAEARVSHPHISASRPRGAMAAHRALTAGTAQPEAKPRQHPKMGASAASSGPLSTITVSATAEAWEALQRWRLCTWPMRRTTTPCTKAPGTAAISAMSSKTAISVPERPSCSVRYVTASAVIETPAPSVKATPAAAEITWRRSRQRVRTVAKRSHQAVARRRPSLRSSAPSPACSAGRSLRRAYPLSSRGPPASAATPWPRRPAPTASSPRPTDTAAVSAT
mmetsp:Transcript_18881/g.63267  ORF Transcript_18881/g.63267 Transcript_18881/m.63267 type:complete len:249 (+) Transcript_18881:212-958(+)